MRNSTSGHMRDWQVIVAGTGWRRTAVMARTVIFDVVRQHVRGEVARATLRHKSSRREFDVVSTYMPHVVHDNDDFTTRIQEPFDPTRMSTTLWMGDFNTKLTTDGHRLRHSYKDEAGEDSRLAHFLPTTRPHQVIDANRRALLAVTLEARQAISLTNQLQPTTDVAGARNDYTHQNDATHHRSCMDYIFASTTLQDDLAHSEVCHDLPNRSEHIPLLIRLRWTGTCYSKEATAR